MSEKWPAAAGIEPGTSDSEADVLTTRPRRPEVISTPKFGYLRNNLRRTMFYPHNMHIFRKLLTCRISSAMFGGRYLNQVGVAVNKKHEGKGGEGWRT